MEAYLGAPESYDAVTVEAIPGSRRRSPRLHGTSHGVDHREQHPEDPARHARLRTMADMPIPSGSRLTVTVVRLSRTKMITVSSDYYSARARGFALRAVTLGRQPPLWRLRSSINTPRSIPHADTDTVVDRLNAKCVGLAKLVFDDRTGYLRSVLDLLQVPVESQVLVYTQTSLQAQHVKMTTRARSISTHRVGGSSAAPLIEGPPKTRRWHDLLRDQPLPPSAEATVGRPRRNRRSPRSAGACAVTCRGTRLACPA